MLKSTFPRRLVRLREMHSLSQHALALACSISPSTLNEIESGLAKDLKVSTLLKVCKRLRVSPDFLLGFDLDETLVRAPLLIVARVEGKCRVCDHLLIPSEPHPSSECMMFLSEKGRSNEYLSAFFGFPLSAVTLFVEAEYQIRRHRRPNQAG